MRYSASEKFEIIELVEQSSLSIRRTLAPIGITRSTFYDWYSRYQEGGIEVLVDGKPRPRRIWNKIPDKIETAIVNLALEEPDLSPRKLAVNFTDTKGIPVLLLGRFTTFSQNLIKIDSIAFFALVA